MVSSQRQQQTLETQQQRTRPYVLVFEALFHCSDLQMERYSRVWALQFSETSSALLELSESGVLMLSANTSTSSQQELVSGRPDSNWSSVTQQVKN